MTLGKMIGSGVIVVCIAVAALSLQGAATPHMEFAQAKQSGESCQVYGKLIKDSIRMGAGMTQVRFTLQDKKSGEQLACFYHNPGEPVPANFTTATEVRALGTWSPKENAFVVTQMQTKCPSKYDSGQYQEQKSGLPDPRLLSEPRKPGEPAPAAPAPGRN
jgi:cytochrome c-type biogenesis protein CcmE